MNHSEARQVVDDLTRVLDAANVVVFALDTDGRVTEWNRKVSKMMGISKERAMGESLVDVLVCLEFRQQLDRILTYAIGGHETESFEVQLCDIDGRRRCILLSVWTRRGANQEITGVMGVGQDITDRHASAAGQKRRPLAARECHGEVSQACSDKELGSGECPWITNTGQRTEILLGATSLLDATSKAMMDARDKADELMSLIETANTPILGLDRDGLVTEWNPKVAAISGYSKDDAIGQPFVESFIPEDLRESVGNMIAQALDGKDVDTFGFPLFVDGYKCELLLKTPHVSSEISDTQAQTAEDDLAQLIDTANSLIIGVDASGCITEWNRQVVQLTGFQKTTAKGKSFVQSFVSPDYRLQIGSVLAEALEGYEKKNIEFPLFTRDGSRREILLSTTARHNAKGEVTSVLCMGQDITHLQGKRRVSDDFSFFETALQSVFSVDTNGKVTGWNREAAELSGYTKQETLGQSLLDRFVAVDLKAEFQEALTQACQGVGTANFEMTLLSKAGLHKVVQTNLTPRWNALGTITGCVGIVQDITETDPRRITGGARRVLETLTVPVFGINDLGVVIEWNQKAAEVLGYTKEEMLSRPLLAGMVTKGDTDLAETLLCEAYEGSEVTIMTKDGRRIDMLLNATPKRDVNGRVTSVLAVGQE